MPRPKQIDFKKCINDFPYYADGLLRIKNKDSQLISLNLNEPQVRLQRALDDLQTNGKLQRVIVLKARQEGISTYSEGRLFHYAHLNENSKNVIIAHDKESGGAIFGMCRLFYDCLPKPFRPLTRYSSKRELVFENPDIKTRFNFPGLRSSLEVYTAGKKSVARGTTIHNLHCSELGSWPFPEEVIPALLPTVPKNANNLIVYESTAKGVGNFFHQEWLAAEEGESNFLPFFLSWFDLSEYAHGFNTVKDRDIFVESLNDEEKELTSVHGLSPEQLYWRRLTIADLRGDVELFRQEYPATAEEAFIVSGSPLFDRRKLRLMALKCKEPKFRGGFSGKTLTPNEQGSFKVWKQPEVGQSYVLGCDVADGGQGGDYSCIEVFKKLPNPYVAEQVAEWHGHLDPYNFAHVIEKVARWYNDGLCSVEVNAHGLATQQELQKNYWNLYRQEFFDRYKNQYANKIGWDTTERSKKLLISFSTHCIADMTIIIHSSDLIRECMTFVRTDTGGGEASGSGYDDRVMSMMISLFTLHQVLDEEPIDSVDFQTQASPISFTPKVDPNFVDKEFAQILAFGKDNDYESSWLNY